MYFSETQMRNLIKMIDYFLIQKTHQFFLNFIDKSGLNYEMLGIVIAIFALLIPSSLQLLSTLKGNSKNSSLRREAFYDERLIVFLRIRNFTFFLFLFSIFLLLPQPFKGIGIKSYFNDKFLFSLELLYLTIIFSLSILTFTATIRFCNIIYLYTRSNKAIIQKIKKDIKALLE